MSERLYHGGVPGLRVGDTLTGDHERRTHDGCPYCAARAEGGAHRGIDGPSQRSHVYATTDREYARFYASMYGLGDLYTVQMPDDAIRSTEDHFDTWTAPSARVTGVVSRAVLLTDHQRRALQRRWRVADYRVAGVIR